MRKNNRRLVEKFRSRYHFTVDYKTLFPFLFFFLFTIILGMALAFRFPLLELRPMHHDEANQAVKFGQLLEDGFYRYDPGDHHGPSLYYLSLLPVRLLTGSRFADTNETTLRLVPASFGMGTILLLLLFYAPLSRGPGGTGRSQTMIALPGPSLLVSALLFSISPLLVFYSRFYIQETLLLFFSIGSIAAGWRYYRKPGMTWAILTGLSLGMAYCTKETSLVIFASFLGALVLTKITSPGPPTSPTPIAESPNNNKKSYYHPLHLLASLGAAAIVIFLFYSSFLQNLPGPLDSLLSLGTYSRKAMQAGFHTQPWYYYLKMLLYTKYGSGPTWSEAPILLLALVGGFAAFKDTNRSRAEQVFSRFIFFYTVLCTAIFSFFSYKTPWNMLPFYFGMVILAASGIVFLVKSNRSNLSKAALILVLCSAGIYTGYQCYQANFVYYADNRNPYVYAHTLNDFTRLVRRIEDISRLYKQPQDVPVKVIASPYETWPLPWYLRAFHRVGYWQHAQAAALSPSDSIIVAAVDKAGEIDKYLGSTSQDYQIEYYGLRPGVLMMLYIRQDTWQEFMQERTR